MKKSTKIWCLIAAVLMLLGAGLSVIAVKAGASTLLIWANGEFKPAQEETSTSLEKTKLDAFHNMELEIQSSNVEFIPSEDFYIEMDECIGNIDYEVKEDTLVVKQKGRSAFSIGFEFFDFQFGKEKENTIRIYYPEEYHFGQVTMDLDMGDIELESLYADNVKMELDMGNITAQNVNTGMLDLDCDMGDADFTQCLAQQLDVKVNMGNADFNEVSSEKIGVDVDTGDVNIVKLDLTSEGNITCDMGNVTISFQKPVETYQICAKIDMGTILINDEDYGSKHRSEGEVPLTITGNMGDIELNFAQ